MAAWQVPARQPQLHEAPPFRNNASRVKFLGEGEVGMTYLEERPGWPVHAVKYVEALVVAEVRCAAAALLSGLSCVQDCNSARRELVNLRLLSHPNVVSFYGAEAVLGLGGAATHLAIMTEAILGPNDLPWSLSDCLHAQVEKRLCELQARSVTAQLAAGLQFMHQHGVAHRDLTLDNVLVRQAGQGFTVKLVDFGSSKNVFHSLPVTARRTETSFAAPEVLLADHAASRGQRMPRNNLLAADLWSVGIMLLFCLKGVEALRRETAHLSDITTLALDGQLVPLLHGVVNTLDAASLVRMLLLACLVEVPELRITAPGLVTHPWIAAEAYVPTPVWLPRLQTEAELLSLVQSFTSMPA